MQINRRRQSGPTKGDGGPLEPPPILDLRIIYVFIQQLTCIP